MKTETEARFEESLKDFFSKLNNSKLVFDDGFKLYSLAENMLMRYKEIKESRDNWKFKYETLVKESKK